MALFRRTIPISKNAGPPARNYVREMKSGTRIGGILSGIGRVGSALGKELTKPGPQRAKGAAGVSYGLFKGKTTGLPVQEAIKHLRASNIPQAQKKLLEVAFLTEGRKDRSEFVTKQKVQGVQKTLEELIGAKETELVLGRLQMDNPHSIFGTGGMLAGQKIGQHVRGMKNLVGYKREIAARLLEGLDQKPRLSGQHGFTEEQFANIVESVEKEYGPHAARNLEKQFFPIAATPKPDKAASQRAGYGSYARRPESVKVDRQT